MPLPGPSPGASRAVWRTQARAHRPCRSFCVPLGVSGDAWARVLAYGAAMRMAGLVTPLTALRDVSPVAVSPVRAPVKLTLQVLRTRVLEYQQKHLSDKKSLLYR